MVVFLLAQLTAFENAESIRRRGTIAANPCQYFCLPELVPSMEMGLRLKNLSVFENAESIEGGGHLPKARSMSIFLSLELAHHMGSG